MKEKDYIIRLIERHRIKAFTKNEAVKKAKEGQPTTFLTRKWYA